MASLLAESKKSGAKFDRILTLGHLDLMIPKAYIHKLSKKLQTKIDEEEFGSPQYADSFLKIFLQAREVASMDVSAYEECDIIHDLNYPITTELEEQFDTVIDGGTIEHVFNAPIALSNCMRLLKAGGRLFIWTMANNHMGHGFYQFSPEFFFNTLNLENGFKIHDLILVEHRYPGVQLTPLSPCYRVSDTTVLKRRIGAVTKNPVCVMVHAERIKSKQPFSKYPIQSDYQEIHESGRNPGKKTLARRVKRKLLSYMPAYFRRQDKGMQQLGTFSLSNKEFFTPWKL